MSFEIFTNKGKQSSKQKVRTAYPTAKCAEDFYAEFLKELAKRATEPIPIYVIEAAQVAAGVKR